jgi:acetate kinase
MTDAILVVNAGSTSLKFAAYAIEPDNALSMICRGAINDIHGRAHFQAVGAASQVLVRHDWDQDEALDQKSALQFIVTWLKAQIAELHVVACGHRILLGGERFSAPILIDGDVLDYLDGLAMIAPSHQTTSVAGARTLAAIFPSTPQFACFDNAFHATIPQVAQTYALPKDVRDAGIRHWGYHGISFDYVAGQVGQKAPEARRVILAHLGGGASLCALMNGKSVETTMGFSALSGLTMATRCGDVPPEVIFFLLREGLFDVGELENMLYERSGLLGLSGISDDMQVLQESDDPCAVAAVAHFIYAITKYAGSYASVMGGLDALVFTGGIGEHSAKIRGTVCDKLRWLGVKLDEDANAAGNACISTPDSRVSLWVIPTDEEAMIAQYTRALLDI